MTAPLVLISYPPHFNHPVMAPKRYTACGITWDIEDIVRFLGKCKWERHIDGDGKLHICLIFTGARSRGKGNKQWYGSFWTKGKTVRAHKFFAVAIMGLRPGPGDELDHNCYNTRCVSCLECVTREINQGRIRRGASNAIGAIRQVKGPVHPRCNCVINPTGPSVPPGSEPG